MTYCSQSQGRRWKQQLPHRKPTVYICWVGIKAYMHCPVLPVLVSQHSKHTGSGISAGSGVVSSTPHLSDPASASWELKPCFPFRWLCSSRSGSWARGRRMQQPASGPYLTPVIPYSPLLHCCPVCLPNLRQRITLLFTTSSAKLSVVKLNNCSVAAAGKFISSAPTTLLKILCRWCGVGEIMYVSLQLQRWRTRELQLAEMQRWFHNTGRNVGSLVGPNE